jgi:hypothetical protein
VADTATTVLPVATTTVPPVAEPIGEPYDFWVPVPSEGAIIGVVGVRHDDMLNIRSGPDVTFDVIATLEPNRIDRHRGDHRTNQPSTRKDNP